METQVTARHFDASPALRAYAAKRLAKLERYYDGIVDARVTLGTDGSAAGKKTAEISVGVYGQRLVAEDQAASHETAIDNCVERLRRQVLKYKDRLRSTDKDYMK